MNSFDAIRLFVLTDFYFTHKELINKYNCGSIIGIFNIITNNNIIYESDFKNWGDLVDYIVSIECFKNISEYINKDKLMSELQNNNEFRVNIDNKSLYYFLDKSIDKNQIYCIDLKRLDLSREYD